MAQLFKNNAFSSLAASLTNTATTLTVTTGHGDRLPVVSGSDFFMLTLQDASNNIEIVRVTNRTAGADSMTVIRAQEGTTARAWNIGDVVELRLTAFALNPLALLEGSSTAEAMRAILDVPSRAGGDSSGTWAISISGNAETVSSITSDQVTDALGFTPVSPTGEQTISGKTLTGLREVSVALGSSSAIDLAAGNSFSKTITQATTFTPINVAASGTLNSFLLDLTNGGSSTITWWAGIKWPGGTAPVLTASGRDVLGFFSADGGTTWTGFVAKDVR